MRSRRLLPVLLLLFVGSGCAALIYEVVWFQLLQLVIGSSAISLAVLLGTFMGGLCLGSLGYSRVASARHHPLRMYALLEAAIGVIGLLVLVGMPVVGSAYSSWAGPGTLGVVLRALAAGVCLLPPTLLMGATLPALSRWIEMTPRGVSWLGFFYAGNTAGAVIGSVLAGFYLLRVYDLTTATLVAFALNAAVAAAAFLVASISAYDPLRIQAAADRPDVAGGTGAAGPAPALAGARLVEQRTIFLAIALSGFTALSAEVVWTRLLSLLFGGTTYTFSLILAGFLLGLGLGSSLALGARTESRASGRRAGLVPGGRGRGGGMGRHHGRHLDAVLADQSLHLHESVVQLPDGRGALPLGGAAGGHPLGRELPAGAGGERPLRRRPGADCRPALRGEHAGRDHRRAGSRRAGRLGGQPAHAAVHDRRGRHLGAADAPARARRQRRRNLGRPVRDRRADCVPGRRSRAPRPCDPADSGAARRVRAVFRDLGEPGGVHLRGRRPERVGGGVEAVERRVELPQRAERSRPPASRRTCASSACSATSRRWCRSIRNPSS